MTTLTPATPESAVRKRRVALIAHDHKKDDMVAFAQTHQAFLSQCDLLATGTTGGRLEKEVGLTGICVTKLDGTARGGVVVALAKQFPVAIPFVGVGEGIADLRPFQATDFARALVGAPSTE